MSAPTMTKCPTCGGNWEEEGGTNDGRHVYTCFSEAHEGTETGCVNWDAATGEIIPGHL